MLKGGTTSFEVVLTQERAKSFHPFFLGGGGAKSLTLSRAGGVTRVQTRDFPIL